MNVSSIRSFVQVRLAVAAVVIGIAPASDGNPERERCANEHAAPGCVRPLDGSELRAVRMAASALARHEEQACRALGAFVLEHAGDARIVPYPIRTPYGAATGDAHVREQPEGSGRVHVADSIVVRDVALARPLDAKVATLLHDFAHLALDLPQTDAFLAEDLAAGVALRCLGD